VLVEKANAKAEGERVKKIKSRLPQSGWQATTDFGAKDLFTE
jgi:hypothetical protein